MAFLYTRVKPPSTEAELQSRLAEEGIPARVLGLSSEFVSLDRRLTHRQEGILNAILTGEEARFQQEMN